MLALLSGSSGPVTAAVAGMAKALTSFVFLIWASSRWDVLLHLLLWVSLGGILLTTLYLHDVLALAPILSGLNLGAKTCANEILEILPDYALVHTASSLSLCIIGLFLLSSSQTRFTWTVFVVMRILFPVASACETRVETEADLLTPRYWAYCCFLLLSFVGPLASSQSRTFAITDFALYLSFLLQNSGCDGGEVAFLAALICMLHDLVVRFQLFVLVESVCYSAALVWALHIFVSQTGLRPVAQQTPVVLGPYAEQEISAGVLFWSLGMFARTYSQARMSSKHLTCALVVPALYLAGGLPAAAAGSVLCWTFAKQVSRGRRKIKPTRNFFSLRATALFAPLQEDLTQDVLDAEEEELRRAELAKKQLSFEEAVTKFQAFSPASFETKAAEEAKLANPAMKSAMEIREERIGEEEELQRFISKKLFYLEALAKGQQRRGDSGDGGGEEGNSTMAELQQYKDMLKASIETKNRLLAEI